MLTKPLHGWTDFSLGTEIYYLSHITNIPLEWLDRAIFGLETLLPFEVRGDCEPGQMVCTVAFSHCHIRFRNDRTCEESVPVTMLEFCKQLHRDISANLDAWTTWGTHGVTKEDLQRRLDRLQKLMEIKENCFR